MAKRLACTTSLVVFAECHTQLQFTAYRRSAPESIRPNFWDDPPEVLGRSAHRRRNRVGRVGQVLHGFRDRKVVHAKPFRLTYRQSWQWL